MASGLETYGSESELQETEHWLGRAECYGYLKPTVAADLRTRCQAVGRLLGGMLNKPGSFVPHD